MFSAIFKIFLFGFYVIVKLFSSIPVDHRTGYKMKRNYKINKHLLLRSKSKKSKNYENINYYLVTAALEFNLELFYSIKTMQHLPLIINCYYIHIVRVYNIATKKLLYKFVLFGFSVLLW